MAFGGGTPDVIAATEKYDGTSWTTTGSLNTARRYLAGAGTQTAGLAFGGLATANTAETEEFNGGTVTVAVPVSQS